MLLQWIEFGFVALVLFSVPVLYWLKGRTDDRLDRVRNEVAQQQVRILKKLKK